MGVRRSVTGILAGTLGCFALLLSACGGGDDSVADPPVSPATSSPTESAQHESAEQFIRRFVSVSNKMEAHGGTSDYLALTIGCKPCESLATQIREARHAGGFYRSKGWSLREIQPEVHGGRGTVDVSVSSAPTTYRTAAHAPVQHYTGGWTVLRLTQSVQNGKTRTIELLVDSAPTTYTPSKGAAPNHLKGGREHFQIEVRPTGNSWVVVEFVEIGS